MYSHSVLLLNCLFKTDQEDPYVFIMSYALIDKVDIGTVGHISLNTEPYQCQFSGSPVGLLYIIDSLSDLIITVWLFSSIAQCGNRFSVFILEIADEHGLSFMIDLHHLPGIVTEQFPGGIVPEYIESAQGIVHEVVFRVYQMDYPDYRFYDTLTASRRQFGQSLPNHQLHTVAAACGYDLQNHHHALADAEACAAIALYIL